MPILTSPGIVLLFPAQPVPEKCFFRLCIMNLLCAVPFNVSPSGATDTTLSGRDPSVSTHMGKLEPVKSCEPLIYVTQTKSE